METLRRTLSSMEIDPKILEIRAARTRTTTMRDATIQVETNLARTLRIIAHYHLITNRPHTTMMIHRIVAHLEKATFRAQGLQVRIIANHLAEVLLSSTMDLLRVG